VLYDALPSAHNAATLLKRVTHKAGQEARLSLWKFDHLDLPQTREQIRLDISRANLIIVCAPCDLRLPENARMLLDQWGAHRTAAPRAIAAILSASRNPRFLHGDKAGIPAFLEYMEQAYPVCIFVDKVPQSLEGNLGPGFPQGFVRNVAQRRHRASTWGLNE